MKDKRRCMSYEELEPHNCEPVENTIEGINLSGPVPDCAGKYKGRTLLIVARAACMWQDYAAAKDLLGPIQHDTMAINSAALHIKEDVHHIVTAHPELIQPILQLRTSPYFNGIIYNTPMCHSDKKHSNCVCWPGIGNQIGTSGMLGCLVALLLGYDRIILAGMPIDFSQRHYDDPPSNILSNYDLKPSKMACAVYMSSWSYAINSLPTFAKNIRSMSGPTSAWLDKPSDDWLQRRDKD